MSAESILIFVLGVACVLLGAILILVLLKRRGGFISPSAIFESISKRLDELSKMQAKLGELENLFLAPQKRGLLGETSLEALLTNLLPRGTCRFQHQFADGVRVDALVKIGARYVPIDAKFPLEAVRPLWDEARQAEKLPAELRRILMNCITDIGRKYIQPREHTFNFALMYVPSEALFYEGFVRFHGNDDLFSHALKKRVIPVSPSGLFLYLETILYGMKGYEIDRNYDELIRAIEQLTQDAAAFARTFATAGTHLKNLSRAFDESARNLEKLEQTAARLGGNKGASW
jgi:DNA recombination protein RmuC